MSGLLAGLEKLGLKNLENMDVYEEEKKKKEREKERKNKALVVQETDFLFDKTYECPVCDCKIKARTMKAGKARLLHTDMDLRPVYENIEPLKYEVIVCPECGYAAIGRYFSGLTDAQIRTVKETISKSYKKSDTQNDIYTYEEAIGRYKLCLANAIVKHAKASEKAYICLKAGWLLRSMIESMDEEEGGYARKVSELKEQEREFLKNALDGFLSAREAENYPMGGMDETTVEILIANLAMEFEQYDIASKIISGILISTTANSRMKDKARETKEVLLAKIKEKNAS